MPTERFKRAARRLLDGRAGKTATLTNYSQSGTNDQGDPVRDSGSSETNVSALFRRARGEPRSETNEVGRNPNVDVDVWVPDDVTETPVAPASDDVVFPTEITDEVTGDEYEAIRVWDEDNGMYRIAARRV